MRRRTWRQDEERLRAAATDEVVRIADLTDLGIHRDVAYARCRPGGPWQLILPGVALLCTGTPTDRQRLRAALVYGGAGARITGGAACELAGLRAARPAGRVHLLIPEAVRRRSTAFVDVERTQRLPEPCSVQGFDCAGAARAVLDHARRMGHPDHIRALLAEAVQRARCSVTDLFDELDAGSQRGTALVRDVLQDISGGARSVAEVRAMRVARRSGLPEPLWNVRIYDEHGAYVGTPDAWFAEVGLAWEIDSHEFHLSPADHERTMRRDNRYAAALVDVLHTPPSHLVKREAEVITALRTAYRAAARTPTPPISTNGTSVGSEATDVPFVERYGRGGAPSTPSIGSKSTIE